jgi:hypothetical protein
MTSTDGKNGDFPQFTPTAVGRTKTGRLRELFDEIEAAKAAGWRYEYVVLALREQGLELSIDTLKDAMRRIRAERRQSPDSSQSRPAAAPKKGPAISGGLDGKPGTRSGNTFSAEGYRKPLQTFSRDITRRTNLDE